LPGAGKSTLARVLATRLGGVVLDKDRVREALFPGSFTDYSREQDDLCVRAMLKAAAYLSDVAPTIAGRARADFIFLDGRTFSRREQIDEIVHAANEAGVVWRILHVTCNDDVAEARLSKVDAENPARNRDVELYRRIKVSFEPITYTKLDVDTTNGIEPVIEDICRFLAQP
jgi:predicted kinase